MKTQRMVSFAWGLSLLVSLLAVIGWTNGFKLEFENWNLYRLFPLFGLLAFSLMWAHYVVGAVRRLVGVEREPLNKYFEVTGWAALVFFLLHPSLLALQLFRDGAGLPPGSTYEYVGPAMKWALSLGILALLIFLSFELKRWFSNKGWWKIIDHAQVVAMFAIVAHSFALGSNLQTGWFRIVWIWYALSLLLSASYIYYLDLKQAKKEGDFKQKAIEIALVVVVIIAGAVFASSNMKKDDNVEQTNSNSMVQVTSQNQAGSEVSTGTPHSSSAVSQLERLRIGLLSQ